MHMLFSPSQNLYGTYMFLFRLKTHILDKILFNDLAMMKNSFYLEQSNPSYNQEVGIT